MATMRYAKAGLSCRTVQKEKAKERRKRIPLESLIGFIPRIDAEQIVESPEQLLAPTVIEMHCNL